MSGVLDDVRPASAAVKSAADLLMVRWTAGALGGGAAVDAQVLRHLYALDKLAEDLAEIEARRGRPAQTDFEKVWSAFSRPYDGRTITIGTLWAMAKDHGWKPKPWDMRER